MVPTKLQGRAFYESIGSPKFIVAPMVDQSEFAWRLLTRSFLPPDLRSSVLAYSPMMHAKLFAETPKYRNEHFKPLKAPAGTPAPASKAEQNAPVVEGEPFLDGNPAIDRPLFMQFCANDPDKLLEAAKHVAPFVDAVDLNLGCPQGIAKKGKYGAFLQEDWDLIHRLINKLHNELEIPVTAKIRVLETKEKTLDYAKMVLNAGANILTVHGRLRDQKGHNTGLADWKMIRYLRDNLPKETVMFANGNILQHADIQTCIDETGVDGIMSAEGNLYDPSIFSPGPPVGQEGREYWRGHDGKGGYRVDAVLRRYLDIIYEHVLMTDPPQRGPLFMPSDPVAEPNISTAESDDDAPPAKKQKRMEEQKAGKKERATDANLIAMQGHLFHMLRPLVSKHTNVRDALARCRKGDMEAYENVLKLTEAAVKEGLLAYKQDPSQFDEVTESNGTTDSVEATDDNAEAAATRKVEKEINEAIRRCKRPFFVCQPYVRPLPKEALEKGSLQLSKKEKAKLKEQEEQAKKANVAPEGKTEVVESGKAENSTPEVPAMAARADDKGTDTVEIPKEGMVCG